MRKLILFFVCFFSVIATAIASPTLVGTPTVCSSGTTTSQNFSCSFTSIGSGHVAIVVASGFNVGNVTFTSITGASQFQTNTNASNQPTASACIDSGTSSVTVNGSATGTAFIVQVLEFSGTVTPCSSVFDGENIQNPASPPSITTCSPSSITPTVSGDLIAEFVSNNTDNASPGQGSYATSPVTTTTIENANNSAEGIANDFGFSIYNSTSAITGTWTWSAAQDSICGFLALKASISNPTLYNPWWPN